jgi:demethylmenaquinone methyltransferase / 2-methoxy-6-polyprenyl-1,4-benzoquinol methylase
MLAGEGADAPAGASPASATMPPAADVAGPGTLTAAQVRAMFDRIAGVYDAMNTAMTAGMHHRWRARAAELARAGPGARVLDVATGTGDLALELAARVAPQGTVVGCDFSEAMLERARAKASRSALAPRFEWADALALPYEDAAFDAATVGFGARNFSDLSRGLAEMTRVVRPGGRVVVLEITTPSKPPLSLFYRFWFDALVPLLGRMAGSLGGAAGAGDAYAYLPSSVRRFPGPAELADEMARAGLTDISYVITAGGIIAIHAGTVPA